MTREELDKDGANTIEGAEDQETITEAAEDPFDLSKLRLDENSEEPVGAEQVITTVPVRKPHKQMFFRVHPNPEFRVVVTVIEVKDENRTYFVPRSLRSKLTDLTTRKLLVTCTTRQNDVFLWPLRLRYEEGRQDEWNRSAHTAAEMAEKHWIKIAANMKNGCYDIYKAIGSIPEPEWPKMSFEELLRIAFGEFAIKSVNDPIIKQLRGAV